MCRDELFAVTARLMSKCFFKWVEVVEISKSYPLHPSPVVSWFVSVNWNPDIKKVVNKFFRYWKQKLVNLPEPAAHANTAMTNTIHLAFFYYALSFRSSSNRLLHNKIDVTLPPIKATGVDLANSICSMYYKFFNF